MENTYKNALGICCGSTTITAVEVTKKNGSVIVDHVDRRRHDADAKDVLLQILDDRGAHEFDRVAATGRQLRHLLDLSTISEPLAVETALRFSDRNGYDAIVSAGGETFAVYMLDGLGKIRSVHTGNKCASGTGEFFLQQIRRMGVSLDDAIKFAESEEPYHVSGRCSVFCKSDCTHASNKGVPKGQVIAGLCGMMAGKVLELLSSLSPSHIMMIGGTSLNTVLTSYLKRELSVIDVPDNATYFEAFGAACWALENETKALPGKGQVFRGHSTSFETHPPLKDSASLVSFSQTVRGTVKPGDMCILGVDVGSTTTKATLVRVNDLVILSSDYLRTNGDPVGASRRCYSSILSQLDGTPVEIIGLGITGSGRQIVGLHGQTEGVINEIIAHATASIHFDPDVDTIFEIGGQDAKYTYISDGVASDYAMNEACSAGTGSFLEESAKESLGIDTEAIADVAMEARKPPNFNDQCAAFISSDVKNALHEGVSKHDIAAGLVYSVCLNYVNRVKGPRPVGKKVFMQGGVCYNRAVPLAMAALTGKEIIVPPEPGLAGAYGVALEVHARIEKGLLSAGVFSLESLAERSVSYGRTFSCKGGREKCDLGCNINRIVIDGKTYLFGGSCNRYYNLRKHINVDAGSHDLVELRHKLVFETYAADNRDLQEDAPTVGINRSFLTNTLYPFYSTFFVDIGFRVVLPDTVLPEGAKRTKAPFCNPCELAHGFFLDLLSKRPDVLFLPHVKGMKTVTEDSISTLCPLVQGEPFYLKGAFERELDVDAGNGPMVLSPLLDFTLDIARQKATFVEIGRELGIPKRKTEDAFAHAASRQQQFVDEMHRLGSVAIEEIESDPDRMGVILFGRPYNSFSPEGHKGIPQKFASRGITVIPVDFLRLDEYDLYDQMYWSMGQVILKGAEFVAGHPQLFGTFVTNFSCGPDSFLIGYFRDLMNAKPSLTLELDDHTADAGLETRIEAFLDIVDRHRLLTHHIAPKIDFIPAKARLIEGKFYAETADGERISLKDRRLKLVVPSMGRYGAPSFAAACRCYGVNAEPLGAMEEEDLVLGKGNSLCKECLPLQLTTGGLLRYIAKGRPEEEMTAYFMPTASGPCRFGQYQVFMNNLIKKKHIPRVTLMSLSAADNYGGLGSGFVILGWLATLVADCFQDIHYAMLVNAGDPFSALDSLQAAHDIVLAGLEAGRKSFTESLKRASAIIKNVPAKRDLHGLPRVLLAGEIYVRQEDLARQWLPEYFAEHGIVTHVAPVHEWVFYTNWLRRHGQSKVAPTFKQKATNRIVKRIMDKTSRQVKSILGTSGWYIPVNVDIDYLTEIAKSFISPNLHGEAILTVAGPLAGLGSEFCGAIAIGPFGCMPNRLSESVLSGRLDKKHLTNLRRDRGLTRIFDEVEELPFLAIEVDGGSMPQTIRSRLETFVLQAQRLQDVMLKAGDPPG